MAIHAIDSKIPLYAHIAPIRKQSADVRLMFELAVVYHRSPNPQTLIVIVSRDDLLLAAAEALNSLGHSVLVAIGATVPTPPLMAELPVVLLPPVPPPQKTIPKPVEVAQLGPSIPDTVDVTVVNTVIAKIRQALPQNKDGYTTLEVGQILSKLGYDKNMRKNYKVDTQFKRSGFRAE
jgi:hypothetical protein